ncbi:hypothetical protein [Roseovarius sp.]|uniref:hypothetical protein n=1 Tax=Roseovarius sp. TaxID=1486281 RepID=UPI00257E7252|nr:hypothetical protein [Roseovarius sp.]
MLIHQLQFDDVRFSPDAQEHRAVAILTTEDRTLCLMASAKLAPSAPRDSLAREFAADALRQVRRMPEYRREEDQVRVAEDAGMEFCQAP